MNSGIGLFVCDTMLRDVRPYSRTKPSMEVFRAYAAHNLINGQILSVGVFPLQKGSGNENFVGYLISRLSAGAAMYTS